MLAPTQPLERNPAVAPRTGRRHRPATAIALLIAGVAACLGPQPTALAGPVDQLVAQVTAESYRFFLDDLLYTHNGHDRAYGPEHDLARQNIVDHFESLGLETSLEPFLYRNDTYFNVVGTITGSTRPDEIYIVGAHFDSAGTPGADDNGSGTACVMEIARVLAAHRFEATIVFIAFDREEQGLYGSKAYADAHRNDDIRGMISTDMVAFNPNQTNRAAIYGRSSSDPCKQALGAALATWGGIEPTYYGVMDRSDHAPFEWEGFEAALLIEHEWGSNPHYHRSTDSVDTPNYIDYEFAANMTRGTLGWLVTNAGLLDAVLAAPVPGVAGQVNQWALSGAAPQTRTYFVYSLSNGTFEVPNCPGLFLGMSSPAIAGSTTTDSNGEAVFARFVPRGAAGLPVGVQAVQPSNCTTSNADWFEFR